MRKQPLTLKQRKVRYRARPVGDPLMNEWREAMEADAKPVTKDQIGTVTRDQTELVSRSAVAEPRSKLLGS